MRSVDRASSATECPAASPSNASRTSGSTASGDDPTRTQSEAWAARISGSSAIRPSAKPESLSTKHGSSDEHPDYAAGSIAVSASSTSEADWKRSAGSFASRRRINADKS